MESLTKTLLQVASTEFKSGWGFLNFCGVLLLFTVAFLLLKRSDHILELRLKHLKSMSSRMKNRALSEDLRCIPKIVTGFILAGFLSLVVCAVLLFLAQGG